MYYFSPFDSPNQIPNDSLLPHARPFWWKGDPKSSKIVLCLHGFTGTLHEVLPVAKILHANGYDVAGILTPAHGIKDVKKAKQAMNQTTKETWLNVIRKEVKRVREEYQSVYLFGQSLGGALALIIAAEGLVDAIALTAPAIKLPFGAGTGANLLGWTHLTLSTKPPKSELFVEAYRFMSAHAARELFRTAQLAKKQLSTIQCPVFEAHSEKDPAISSIVPKWLQQKVSGPVEIHWYNNSGHTMPLDVQGPEICQDILAFFNKLP